MISEYVQAALNETEYDWMEEEGEYFAAPPSIPGAWATGKTVEAARNELREVIEDMILVSAAGIKFSKLPSALDALWSSLLVRLAEYPGPRSPDRVPAAVAA